MLDRWLDPDVDAYDDQAERLLKTWIPECNDCGSKQLEKTEKTKWRYCEFRYYCEKCDIVVTFDRFFEEWLEDRE